MFKLYLRLYLRKLFTIIGFVIAIAMVYYVCYPVLGSLGNFFHQSPIRHVITIGIPLVLVFKLIYTSRCNNQGLKADYLNYIRSFSVTEQRFDVKNEFKYLKTFKPLYVEAAAFVTLLLPLVIAIGLKVENGAPILVNCLVGLIVFFLFLGVWLALDVAFWLLVHKKWLK